MDGAFTKVLTECDPYGPMWTCNDCGASGPKRESIDHYPSCTPGESMKWQKIYSELEEEG